MKPWDRGEEFIEMIRKFGDLDVTKNPNLITVKTLFGKLVKAGISEDEAAQIVGNLAIDVNDEFIENYLEETTDIYTDVLLKTKAELNKISPLLFQKYIESNKLTLSYTL